MSKQSNDRPLMRRKVNITADILKKWKDAYMFDIRNLINPSKMKAEDMNTKFEHQEREFEIVGMGESGHIMLRETRTEGIFYWECTRNFVQMKLKRFNGIFKKTTGGKTILVEIPYDNTDLLLPPKSNKNKKKAVVEENEDEFIENEIMMDDFDEAYTNEPELEI